MVRALSTFVTYKFSQYVRVFVTGRPFQSTLLFVGALKGALLGQAPSLLKIFD